MSACVFCHFCDVGSCLQRPQWAFPTCSVCLLGHEWRTFSLQTADKRAYAFAQAQCQLVEFIKLDVFNRNQSMTNTPRRRFAYARKGQGSTELELAVESCNWYHNFQGWLLVCSDRGNIYEKSKHCSLRTVSAELSLQEATKMYTSDLEGAEGTFLGW